jgi:hypothetical protein
LDCVGPSTYTPEGLEAGRPVVDDNSVRFVLRCEYGVEPHWFSPCETVKRTKFDRTGEKLIYAT